MIEVIKKIKKNIKKVLLSLISMFILFTTSGVNISALTGTTGSIVPSDWYLTNPSTEVSGGHEGLLMVNGEPCFCVDYYTAFHRNKTVTVGTFSDIGISEATAKKLSLIAYYGTKVPGRTSQDWYAITQGLIWRVIHNNNSLDYVKNSTTPTFASTQAAWNQILADVDRYYVLPSFGSSQQEVDMDKTLTLTDNNNVLSEMVVSNNGGLDVQIQGNKLVIKGSPNVSDDVRISLKKNITATETGTSVVYTASDCQSLASFKVSDPIQLSFKLKVNKFGNMELVKYNDDKSATILNTTYHITGPEGFDKTVTTDDTGKISLERIPVGDYKCVETKAGDGYLINVSEIGFTVKVDETIKIDPTNAEPIGSIELTKSMDTSKTNNLKGDAYIKDNTYGLYAASIITNKAGTKKFYDKDQLVSSKKTDDGGKITWNDLPLGNYYVKETSSNDTLVLDSTPINVSLKYQGQTVKVVTEKKDTSDRVNMQKIEVFKSGESEGISGVVKGLQGAEFTFRLKSEVDHVGWDNATTYAIITTDANGKANTNYLPYGTYIVKETKTPKDYVTAPDFTVSVTDDYTEYKDVEQVKRINVNNAPFKTQLKLIKIDEESKEKITLNSASFKIKDSKGNYIIQKVGGVKYDTFTTNSKNNVVVSLGKEGEVTLPLMLGAGEYTIEEVETPEGFLTTEPVKFTITNVYNCDIDEDKDPLLTIKITNAQPKGKIVLKKTDKVTGDPLENVEYELTAAEDIYSKVDGTLRFKKGNIVSEGKTDTKGQIVIGGLFMGKYSLKETLTNQEYVLSEEVHDIEFTQKDFSTKVYETSVNVTNIAPIGEIHLIKRDKETKELLGGVTFYLTASEDIYSLDGRNTLIYEKGQNVSVDISENGLYVTNELGEINIGNLPLGKYRLQEVQKLDGYYTNDKVYDIDLSYDHTDKVFYTKYLDIINTKTEVDISKVDATSVKEIPGARLTLTNGATGEVIEQWTSTNEPHIIKGLSLKGEYVLHEDLAPIGYATASDITFTIDDNGKPTKVIMKDEITKVSISKQDATTGKELGGAKLTLTDKETGKVIETWTSTKVPHLMLGLSVNKAYILHEDLSPIGYNTASDIEFTILDTGEIQKVVMKDEVKVVVVKTGDSTAIEGLSMLLGLSGLLALVVYLKIRKAKKNG